MPKTSVPSRRPPSQAGLSPGVSSGIHAAYMESYLRNPCTHGVTFDSEASQRLSSDDVRKKWPRLSGECPLGCGFNGFGYASLEHYIAGDW